MNIHAHRTDAAEPVESFRLANGLDVVVVKDRRAPVVTHMVWYRNGSADDPSGKSGIAHFLEHLMFKGTERWPAGETQAWLVRTEMPEERLAALGLPYDPARAGESVRADLLMHPSGEVLAVRFVP